MQSKWEFHIQMGPMRLRQAIIFLQSRLMSVGNVMNSNTAWNENKNLFKELANPRKASSESRSSSWISRCYPFEPFF